MILNFTLWLKFNRNIGCTMIKSVKKIVRFIIIPVYIACFFSGLFGMGISGQAINFILLYLGMWSFVNRKIPVSNYILSAIFMLFYFILYWTDLFNYVASGLLLPDKWVFYGLIYTILVLGYGFYYLIKRWHDKYQVMRTISVMFVQLILAFILPQVLKILINKEYYFSYLWPLKIEYFYPSVIFKYPQSIIIYSFIASLVLTPILAILIGKRFYCSWICGCGGLAETFGDQYRHLSDKSNRAWQFEKISIHSVLVISIITTIIIFLNWYFTNQQMANSTLNTVTEILKNFYSYVVSVILAGIAGVGFYPVLGSRVWCRFFCPMAAMIGLIQKIGRYKITVKDNMCISCGNCSTYCEMGIDVRSYAQANTSFTRASCVGCGLCAHVCPRGVLKLENK